MLTVEASGLEAGESVEVWLHSDPVQLTTVVADDESVSITVTIPADTEPGSHEIEVRTSDGSVFADLEVTAAGSTAGLATTGYDGAWLIPIAAGLLGAGGLVLLVARRARRA